MVVCYISTTEIHIAHINAPAKYAYSCPRLQVSHPSEMMLVATWALVIFLKCTHAHAGLQPHVSVSTSEKSFIPLLQLLLPKLVLNPTLYVTQNGAYSPSNFDHNFKV